MAGAGYKSWVDGDILTASDVNTYLMQQAVMVFADASARTSAIAAPSEGMVTYLTGTDVIEYYDGAAWQPILDQDVIEAKGDLIVGTADDTVARLAVGTNDYVLTADSAEATGLKWAAAPGSGKLLQVVTATTTTTNTNTSGTYADTNLSASITPTAATSKILILVSQLFQMERTSADNAGHAVRLLRDATAIYTPAQTSPFTTRISAYGTTEVVIFYNLALTYLDSPATTSSITYKTQHNDSSGDSTAQPGTSGGSTITLLEIGV